MENNNKLSTEAIPGLVKMIAIPFSLRAGQSADAFIYQGHLGLLGLAFIIYTLPPSFIMPMLFIYYGLNPTGLEAAVLCVLDRPIPANLGAVVFLLAVD